MYAFVHVHVAWYLCVYGYKKVHILCFIGVSMYTCIIHVCIRARVCCVICVCVYVYMNVHMLCLIDASMCTHTIHVYIRAPVCCVMCTCLWSHECSDNMFYWCIYACIDYSCMLSCTSMLKSAHAAEQENAVIGQCVIFSLSI